MAQNVDPNELIADLSQELGKKDVELAMAKIVIRSLEAQLIAITSPAEEKPAASSPDGT